MKKKFLITIGGFVILTLSIGARFTWENYFSPQAKQNKIFEQNLQKYTSGMEAFEAAMRADTWGGKTPEETLAMFVDALKKGDIDLASKYFMLDTNTQSPDYLTRKKWENGLNDLENSNGISNIVPKLENLPTKVIDDNSGTAVFKLLNKEGVADTLIDFTFNKYSNIWKIESM